MSRALLSRYASIEKAQADKAFCPKKPTQSRPQTIC